MREEWSVRSQPKRICWGKDDNEGSGWCVCVCVCVFSKFC